MNLAGNVAVATSATRERQQRLRRVTRCPHAYREASLGMGAKKRMIKVTKTIVEKDHASARHHTPACTLSPAIMVVDIHGVMAAIGIHKDGRASRVAVCMSRPVQWRVTRCWESMVPCRGAPFLADLSLLMLISRAEPSNTKNRRRSQSVSKCLG